MTNGEQIRDGKIRSCPACGSPTVDVCATGRGIEMRKTKGKYYCCGCGHRFDTPEWREPAQHRNTQSGDAKALLNADPEAWP
jgi:transcription elongation factor Elf1